MSRVVTGRFRCSKCRPVFCALVLRFGWFECVRARTIRERVFVVVEVVVAVVAARSFFVFFFPRQVVSVLEPTYVLRCAFFCVCSFFDVFPSRFMSVLCRLFFRLGTVVDRQMDLSKILCRSRVVVIAWLIVCLFEKEVKISFDIVSFLT